MASLMFIDIETLVTDYAKDHDLAKWEILIVSREIVGTLALRSSSSYGITTDVEFESKYENIEFVPSLRPTPSMLETLFDGNGASSFIELYKNRLIDSEPFIDICCIADMIINSDLNVMIVMSDYELKSHIAEVLREFIEEEFGIYGFMYSDLKRLEIYLGEPSYDKIVESMPFDVPDTFTGRNFEVITCQFNTDEIDKLRENLELQKAVASNINAKAGEEDDLTSIFFNKITETLEEKVREILNKKSLEMIRELCRKKEIRVSPSATKESLIDRIMANMKLGSTREVEYYDVNH